MNKNREIEFVPEDSSHIKIFFENLWNDIVFYSTISWFIIKGYLIWFIAMGGVEIKVGYKENDENINCLYLEKLW